MLLRDFPYALTSADVHRELSARRRKPSESFIEYYYIMLTIGRQGDVDEQSINSYTIDGLNDNGLTITLLAMSLRTSNELRQSLESLRSTAERRGQRNILYGSSSEHSLVTVDTKEKQVKCYNCNVYGHVAAKCPQPQNKQRCTKCSKVGHDAKKCSAESKHTVAKIGGNENIQKMVPSIVEEVECEGRKYQALIDTGSDHSLIKKSGVWFSANRMPTYQRLKGFGGSIVDITYVVNTKIKFADQVISAKLYEVLDNMLNYDFLLGRDVLCGQNRRLIIDSGSLVLEIKSGIQFNVNKNLVQKQQQEVLKFLNDCDECFAEGISTLGRSKTTLMDIRVTTPIQ
ncbi:uncharacterized protein [Eurosta solidaginis]|uniref:uncharacterized protein n=1 Tax=Eurosta solidaginis TaxID=178769 RepID=UPI0035314EB0